MINRPLYMDRLRRRRDKDAIKAVTGVRRCGKSTLLRLFAEELAADGVSSDRIIMLAWSISKTRSCSTTTGSTTRCWAGYGRVS